MNNVLLLIDGLNIVRRVYEANPAPDSVEKADGAKKSSISSIRRALKEVKATHALCIFDFGGSTFRHALHPAYKADRKPMPAPLQSQIPEIRRSLEAALGLKSIAVPEVEAEDVIASITSKLRAKLPDMPVVILTTDKDMCALIGESVRLRDNFNSEYRDAEWVKQKFHVYPDRMVDCLALTGDAVDGVPGVPGIGYKTAGALLDSFGSLDNLLSRVTEVPGKKGEALQQHISSIQLARQLVQLKDTLSVGVRLSDMLLPT